MNRMQWTTPGLQPAPPYSRTDFIELQARDLASHSWEYGTVSHALLSLHNPELTVFSPAGLQKPSPSPLPPGLAYAKEHITTTADTLYPSDQGSISDPASLGIMAMLLGQLDKSYWVAAGRQHAHIINSPRWINGAISHRKDSLSLWADAVAMVPPFIAFVGAVINDYHILDLAIDQIRGYRAELLIRDGIIYEAERKDVNGSWRHIVSEPSSSSDDLKPWSTSNAWALWGITRVLATVVNWEGARQSDQFPFEPRRTELIHYAREIIDAAIRHDDHESGLLRNYLGDAEHAGETSGTALVTAAVYRLVALDHATFVHYQDWADKKRRILEDCVMEDGVVGPAANALNHFDKEPIGGGSAEGQAFMLEMIAASRDWEKTKRERPALEDDPGKGD